MEHLHSPYAPAETPVSAVVVAAGSGTRMGGVSKPELTLGGKPLLAWVLEAFGKTEVAELVVVCGTNREKLEEIVKTVPVQQPVKLCGGGKTRTESVWNGVNACDVRSKLICVHDCDRPFVTPELINEVMIEARKGGAASACAPVTDTVKYVDEEHHAVFTPARKYLLALQTPQVFRRDFYEVAYALALKSGGRFTDETALLEAADVHVSYVRTEIQNMKLTTRGDLLLARAMLAVEKYEEAKKTP